MEAKIFLPDPRGPVPIGSQIWAAVHGTASLLMTKPWLPWGDVDALVERAARVATAGCAFDDRSAEPWLGELAERVADLRPRQARAKTP